MAQPLAGRRVAVLATDGVEQVELTAPRAALDAAGATTVLVSPREHWVTGTPERLRALDTLRWGDEFPVDLALEEADPAAFDALYLPGGIINPDLLRLHPKAAPFVRAFFDAGKPVASMCHGPWLLVSAGVARGRRVAAWPSLRDDLHNAGATWVDEAVVRDGSLVTARNPGDIPQFAPAVVALFAEAGAAASGTRDTGDADGAGNARTGGDGAARGGRVLATA